MSTHTDYSAASCNFARAQRNEALLAVETIRELFAKLRGGLEAVDARCSIPLVDEDLAYALERIEEELGA